MDTGREISYQERHLLSEEDVLAETLVLEVMRANMDLGVSLDGLLKTYGLTASQYEALRVLREAGPQGLTCQHLASSLLTRDPDITRLTDRLEEGGLLSKKRSEADRRVMLVSISQAGLALLAELDAPMAALHVRQTSRLTAQEKITLTQLLARMMNRQYELPFRGQTETRT